MDLGNAGGGRTRYQQTTNELGVLKSEQVLLLRIISGREKRNEAFFLRNLKGSELFEVARFAAHFSLASYSSLQQGWEITATKPVNQN